MKNFLLGALVMYSILVTFWLTESIKVGKIITNIVGEMRFPDWECSKCRKDCR